MTARVPAVLINGRVASLPSGDHVDPGSGGTVHTPLVIIDGRISELAPADSLEASSDGSSHPPLVLINGHVASLPPGDSIVTTPSTTLVNRGVPVTSARQWTTALSPNAAGDGWNYISASFTGNDPDPVEWVVVKNITTTPTVSQFFTTTHRYPNPQFQLSQLDVLRAPNGRIFFPLLDNSFAYYDPTTESVTELGQFTESPPVNPNASQIPYSASFDTAGMLYFATQESAYRQACLVSVNPVSLAVTVLGYFGDNALNTTTYGYYLAPDTIGSTKGVWGVYGENKWQLWFTNITTGVATKLAEVEPTGHMAFTDIAGKGWIVTIHTNGGDPSNDMITKHWCIDGALYDYSVGVDPVDEYGNPVATRNVTPASNPLVNPPDIDSSRGAGTVGWRANGSSGAFTYVDYDVAYVAPFIIELLAPTPDGVLIGAAQYQGFVRYDASSHTGEWFGVQAGNTISRPLALHDATLGKIFVAGYPDGTLFEYDPASPWDTYPTQVNPALIGFYGPSGNQKAGIKYAGDPHPPTTNGAEGSLVWIPTAGTSGRLYCAGTRDRTGTGAGIGYWEYAAGAVDTAFVGTYAAPLDTVEPRGLVGLPSIDCVVMSTALLSGSGSAPLYVFDLDLNLDPVATHAPLSGVADIGQIFPTGNTNIVCGVYSSSGSLALYRWNVQSGTLVQSVSTTFEGAIDATTINQADGSIWIAVGNSIVRVDPDTLAVTREVDITSIAPVSCLAFYGTELYMSSNTTLWSC